MAVLLSTISVYALASPGCVRRHYLFTNYSKQGKDFYANGEVLPSTYNHGQPKTGICSIKLFVTDNLIEEKW